MLQFLRKVRLTYGGGIINPGGIQQHEIKIRFNVSKGIESTANTAEIELWNLAAGTRNALGRELDTITLEAGYMPPIGMNAALGAGASFFDKLPVRGALQNIIGFMGGGSNNVGVIFQGQLRDMEHRRDGADIITKISCGDSDKAFRNATISKSFDEGTPVKEVVEELQKQLEKEGIRRGEWKFPDSVKDKKFRRPYSMCGTVKREMDRIGRGQGFYWSCQNQTTEIIPGDGYIGGVFLISPDTGMIDTPAITDNGVKVSALLNPDVRPNRRVQVESSVLEMNGEGGMYRVSQATYSGDNRDGDFRVDIHGEALQGGKVNEGRRF
jgi:hypothetical protein